jgi:hypothetical protein
MIKSCELVILLPSLALVKRATIFLAAPLPSHKKYLVAISNATSSVKFQALRILRIFLSCVTV